MNNKTAIKRVGYSARAALRVSYNVRVLYYNTPHGGLRAQQLAISRKGLSDKFELKVRRD